MADAHSPFHDLDDYVAIPRMTGLRLSPDGSWLAATVQSLSPDKKKYVTSIWRIDTAGGRRPGSPGRPTARAARGSCPTARCCSSPSGPTPTRPTARRARRSRRCGGCPLTAARPAWSSACRAASRGWKRRRTRPSILLAGEALPGDAAEDEKRRQARKDAGVSAILHETLPVRYWDHDLGPDDPRLFAVDVAGEPAPRDLTPDAGRALSEQAAALSPDGTTVASGWWQWRDGVQAHSELVTIDVASGSPDRDLSRRRVRLRRPGVRPRRRADRLRALGARDPGTAGRHHPGAISRRDRPAARVRPLAVGAVLGPGGHRHLLHRR